MKKDYFSQLHVDDYGEPFFPWVLFVSLLKFKSFDQFNPLTASNFRYLLSFGAIECCSLYLHQRVAKYVMKL